MKDTSRSVNRIVVKVGTSSLVGDSGALDRAKVAGLVGQLAEVKNRGKGVILVSSGAIRAGMERLGLAKRPRNIPDLQASAAIGQSSLMSLYAEAFSRHGVIPAQVLLTRDDVNDRVRYLNARNTLRTLLRFGTVPIVNENDTVATEEIKFGENDTLAALVAACVDADVLLNLSDVDGLYDSDPRLGGPCALLQRVESITPDIEALAGGVGTSGSGGMKSKIEAAKIAVNSGVRVVIAGAARPNVIVDVVAGKPAGTLFLASLNGLSHWKRWLAFGGQVKGSVTVNEGAKKSLIGRGTSLLAAGITGCEGGFDVGDLVSVVDEDSCRIARGLTNYAASEIQLIRGKRSSEIPKILGRKDYDEVIHRDNMVLGV